MVIREDKGNLILEGVKDFNIEQILECGQCFHFEKLGDLDYGLSAYHHLLHISQDGDRVTLFNTAREDYESIWRHYFDMDTDYSEIKEKLLKRDKKLEAAMEAKYGIRILNQEFFETLLSFIISQNKQIPHIKQIVGHISEKYGDYLGIIEGKKFYSFPNSKQLEGVCESAFRECKAGFRAPYLCDAVAKVASKEVDGDRLLKASYKKGMENLMTIKGVGEKVANCVSLFALGKRSAFPVDVWIKRVMEENYLHREMPAKDVEAYGKKRYGALGGYAQQYLFYYGKSYGKV